MIDTATGAHSSQCSAVDRLYAVSIYKGTPPRTSAEHGDVPQDPKVNMKAVSK